MKVFRVILLILATFLFMLCSEDDDGESPLVLGEFTVEGTSYDLHGGMFAPMASQGDTAYVMVCILHATGIYYENDVGFVGKGDAVQFFCLISADQDQSLTLPIIYDEETQMNEAFDVEMIPGFEPDADDDYTKDYYKCTSGTISVSETNEIYTIMINAQADKIDHSTELVIGENIPVTLNYTGAL